MSLAILTIKNYRFAMRTKSFVSEQSPQLVMTVKGLICTLLLILSCREVLGTSMIMLDYIPVTPMNATNHAVWFHYGVTNNNFNLAMPYTNGVLTFDSAILQCTNSARHFRLPIHGIHVDGLENRLLISFWMDPETLRECTLSVRFLKNSVGKAYEFSLRDFIPKSEAILAK